MNKLVPWIVAIIMIAFFIFICLKIDRIYNSENPNNHTSDSKIIQNHSDSILLSKNNDSIKLLSDIISKKEVVIKLQSEKIKQLSKQTKDKVYLFKKDTTVNNADSALMAYSRLSEAQNYVIDSLYYVIQESFKKSLKLTEQVSIQNRQLANASENINLLYKEGKRTWFERNEKYFAFGIGALTTYGAIKMTNP